MTALFIIGSVRRFCPRTLFEQGYHRGICFAPRPGLLLPRRSLFHHLDTPSARVPAGECGDSGGYNAGRLSAYPFLIRCPG